jgi:hypothetical protein
MRQSECRKHQQVSMLASLRARQRLCSDLKVSCGPLA